MIVFPMMGMSQRFKDAGYMVPKYRLKIKDHSMFYTVVSSFREFFEREKFLFIIRYEEQDFIINEIKKLGLKYPLIKYISEPTLGQADTVYKGVEKLYQYNNDRLIIFNIDTIRHNFSIPPHVLNNYDGFLEVFITNGNNWSFIKPEFQYLPIGKVLKTAEKERISSLCSTGLYGFKTIELYKKYFKKAVQLGIKKNNEYYIAPIYNLLINDGYKIGYYRIDNNDVSLVGTPLEYSELIEKIKKKLEFNNIY